MEIFLDRPGYLLAPWLVIMSLWLFAAMGADKRRAIKNARRIPEARLFLFAFLGGAMGGWLGMRVFRHKTRHWYFAYGFPLIALLQLAALLYLLAKA